VEVMIVVVDEEQPVDRLGALFRAHYRDLVRLAALLVDDVGTCEEIVQEAFVQLHRRAEGLRDPERAPAYLRSAVLNGARSHLRHRRRGAHLRLVPPGDAASAEAGAVLDDDRRAVLDAVRRLPDRQRDVVVLRYWLDLPEAEIAATLGIGAGTVKTHVKRAMHALAQDLEERR
jgi:RNA polymerase sigma-70 factor (sigma-E family)